MTTKDISQKYPPFLQALHWVMAVLILGMIGVGWYMTGLERSDPLRMTLYGWHKSFGVIVLALAAARLLVRLRSIVPALPGHFARVEKIAAHASHHLLYVFMFAMPITGYWMSDAVGFGVKFFGNQLPRIFPVNRDLAELMNEGHEILGYSLLALIAVHAAAVVKHALFDRENLLKRML